jgi:hypothetical protein
VNNKRVSVITIDEAKVAYKELNRIVGEQTARGAETSPEIQLLRSIRQKIEFLKINPFYGDNIPKKQIPKGYAVANLWRVELTNYWRMLYTIRGDEVEIICVILDITDHERYDKKFGYRKK